MSNTTAVVALILVISFGILSYLFIGSKALAIGAIVAALLVGVIRVARIVAPKA